MSVSMYIVFVVVAAVVVFAVAAAAVGRGDGLEEPFPDMERPYLPDSRVEPADIDDVHFAVSFRGYRMDQVDSVLDRLAGELVERDRHIARLERMVQTQARHSAMAYSPPRTRVGLDAAAAPSEASAPPSQAPQGEQDRDDGNTLPVRSRTAEHSPGKDQPTGEKPGVAHEPPPADGDAGAGDQARNDNTSRP